MNSALQITPKHQHPQVNDPLDKLMTEEIFGPVVAVYVYPDAEVEKTLQLVGDSTAFALTGSVFAQDQ